MFSSFGLLCILFVFCRIFVSSIIISFTLENQSQLQSTLKDITTGIIHTPPPPLDCFLFSEQNVRIIFFTELNLVQFVCFVPIISSTVLNGRLFICVYFYLSLLTVLMSIE